MTVILVLLLALVVGTYVVFSLAFKGPQGDVPMVLEGEQYKVFAEETRRMVQSLEAEPYEEVWIDSHDGLKLFGRYYRKNGEAPLAICFHGYKGSSYRDFSGGSQILFSLGCNVLLVDERAHGRSEGRAITFGVKEKRDVLSWVNQMEERGEGNGTIFLFGISMGAATVLMASDLDLPSSVKAIVADCPYSSPVAIIRKVIGEMGIPTSLVMPFVRLAARLWAGFSIEEESAAEAVARTKVPVLIIHGLDDRFVPSYMSEEIAKANPEKVRRETFPEAGHGLSYMVDKERYWKLVKEFLTGDSSV